MPKKLEGCVEEVLLTSKAEAGDNFADDFGNTWVVADDRDGLRLQNKENDSAWIPFWTASIIKLPGLHKIVDDS